SNDKWPKVAVPPERNKPTPSTCNSSRSRPFASRPRRRKTHEHHAKPVPARRFLPRPGIGVVGRRESAGKETRRSRPSRGPHHERGPLCGRLRYPHQAHPSEGGGDVGGRSERESGHGKARSAVEGKVGET